jgi:GNAT superfamily N-acetyltransferase
MKEIRDVGDLDASEVRFLKGQTHGMKEGYLRMYLDFCWNARTKYGKEDFMCDIITDKNPMGALNCWCMIQDVLYRHGEYLDFGIWTPKAKRGNGYGSQMLEFVAKHYKDKMLAVWPHMDDASPYLYRKFNEPPFYAFDIDAYKEEGRYERFDFSKLNQ